MSFGALSANAMAFAQKGGFAHDTGEGSAVITASTRRFNLGIGSLLWVQNAGWAL